MRLIQKVKLRESHSSAAFLFFDATMQVRSETPLADSIMSKTGKAQFTVQGLRQATRLDRAIRDRFPEWGRKAVQTTITNKKVQVNGRKVWLCSWKVRNGDYIAITAPPEAKEPPPLSFDDTWIIAEENDLIAVNKPAGLLTQATQWTKQGNLLSLAVERFGSLTLFHRLDRDTSGVVILTCPGAINQYLDAAFKAGIVQKEYLAMVRAGNRLEAEGSIKTRLKPHPTRRDMMDVTRKGGKYAITRYQVTDEHAGTQWLRLWPETGRMHQLRVHLAHMGAPILGDRLYGDGNKTGTRLMLHAHSIVLPDIDTFPTRTFTAPIPDCFLTR